MLFSSSRQVNMRDIAVRINNVVIENVAEIKFLGIFIDHKLNWSKHIDYIKSKILKTIGILFKARYKLSTNELIKLYNVLVLPYLTYCIVIWGKTHNRYLDPLFKMQNKIIRIIKFAKYRAHTDVLFFNTKILKL